MEFSISAIKSNLTYILLTALTGAVIATGMVVLLVSENIGGIQLARWQIAAVYAVAIAASILIGMKSCMKGESEKPAENTSSGSSESHPS